MIKLNIFQATLGLLLLSLPPILVFADDDPEISEVVVTAQRKPQEKLLHAGNIDRLDTDSIEAAGHQHVHELLTRVAGVWVVRGSGQEHLTAIRSPVLSGGGSCGGFLLLEDGIPVRPTGFCNVNQFIELVSEQAASVETIRGPANALFGSNAVHGVINVLMPLPGTANEPGYSLEYGANDYVRVRANLADADSPWLATAVYANDGGFRFDSGYQQGKIHIKRNTRWLDGDLTLAFSATDLDQDTAGFIWGKDAYQDPELRLSNPNPEAFRKAKSQRLYATWGRSFDRFDLDVRPFVRHTDMSFLHHFMPGLPLEENGHTSAGLISAAAFTLQETQAVIGADIEWSDVFLKQTQERPSIGPRPTGKHYDYEVAAISVAGFVQMEHKITDRLNIGGGIRLEHVEYDYNNRMISGNTRDDGTACGNRGCLFTRPEDRKDSFSNIAPKLSASYRLNEQTNLFSSMARGFRVPQMLELYRLQNGQQVSDLKSERIDSLEAGVRHLAGNWSADIVAYTMRKRDSVFRDAEGFNVTGARSRHRGVESAINWQVNSLFGISLDATYARHTYDFTAAGRGEQFVSGRQMDSAPKLMASLELRYEPVKRLKLGLQITTLDEYYLDAQNRFTYPGHTLAHLRASYEVSPRSDFVVRLNNLADESVADRADYASGNYRYFPGRGREVFAEYRYRLID